jgi:hypothetical protein
MQPETACLAGACLLPSSMQQCCQQLNTPAAALRLFVASPVLSSNIRQMVLCDMSSHVTAM